MHPNPVFRQTDTDRSLAFARDRAFGTLAVSAPEGPLMAHVPFLLSCDAATVDCHLVRSNPLARAGDGALACLAVSGPDAYVSPEWYGVPDQVPTWNYVAVHLRGRLERRPDAEMREMLERQSAAYEARLPKPPWTLDKMPEEAVVRMLRMIVPFRLHVEAVESTWKLGQNKEAAARIGAAKGIETGTPGQEVSSLAALMRDLP